jgi:hypothetical protein
METDIELSELVTELWREMHVDGIPPWAECIVTLDQDSNQVKADFSKESSSVDD